MTWLLHNLETIFALYGVLVAACTAVVKYTKTDKDDKVLEKIVKFCDKFSTAFTKEDAEKIAKATKKSKK